MAEARESHPLDELILGWLRVRRADRMAVRPLRRAKRPINGRLRLAFFLAFILMIELPLYLGINIS